MLCESRLELGCKQNIQNFISAHEETTKDCIPVKTKIKQRVTWENEKIITKRELERLMKRFPKEKQEKRSRNGKKQKKNFRKYII